MKVGSLVRLLDVEGNPLPEFLGLVWRFTEKGKATGSLDDWGR